MCSKRWKVATAKSNFLQQCVDSFCNFTNLERLALNLIHPSRVDQVDRPQHKNQLTVVEFGNEDLLILLDDVAEILRKRIEVSDVSVSHFVAFFEMGSNRGAD